MEKTGPIEVVRSGPEFRFFVVFLFLNAKSAMLSPDQIKLFLLKSYKTTEFILLELIQPNRSNDLYFIFITKCIYCSL